MAAWELLVNRLIYMAASVDYKLHQRGEPADQSTCELFDLASMVPLYNHSHRIRTPICHNEPFVAGIVKIGIKKDC